MTCRGINYDDTQWKFTQPDAILGIKRGECQFYVAVNRDRGRVIVVVTRANNKGLETDNYDDPNNLLNLAVFS